VEILSIITYIFRNTVHIHCHDLIKWIPYLVQIELAKQRVKDFRSLLLISQKMTLFESAKTSLFWIGNLKTDKVISIDQSYFIIIIILIVNNYHAVGHWLKCHLSIFISTIFPFLIDHHTLYHHNSFHQIIILFLIELILFLSLSLSIIDHHFTAPSFSLITINQIPP